VVLDAASEWHSEEIPLSRAATHEEVARVVSFLCSPAGSYLTGVNLPVDGGWSRKL
jgi:3-oxoacyl-[acyl-carrier protein] reductase